MSTNEREEAKPRLLAREEDGLLVFDKPAGWVVHAAEADETRELLSWAVQAGHAPPEVAPVHRLDRETSGVVLLSADPALRGALGRAFAVGEVHKTYRALVHGRTHRKGIVRRPLADARRGRPLEAVTRYRTLEWLGGFSLVEVRPETGRRHQIRRHLQMIGHPVVGDERYGPRRFRPVPAFPGRLWLHAARLALPDGRVFESSLPPELESHLDALRAGLGEGQSKG